MSTFTPTAILSTLASQTQQARVFAQVQTPQPEVLLAPALGSAAPAEYFVELARDLSHAWVGLRTSDRWLSESIETDLLHTGDKMEDLLADELTELGLEAQYPVEHFRDDQKRYVFRSRVALDQDAGANPAQLLATVLLAYEATFRNLGDMQSPEE